jgi:hypothetical protein
MKDGSRNFPKQHKFIINANIIFPPLHCQKTKHWNPLSLNYCCRFIPLKVFSFVACVYVYHFQWAEKKCVKIVSVIFSFCFSSLTRESLSLTASMLSDESWKLRVRENCGEISTTKDFWFDNFCKNQKILKNKTNFCVRRKRELKERKILKVNWFLCGVRETKQLKTMPTKEPKFAECKRFWNSATTSDT